MENNSILEFKNKIKDFTIDELNDMHSELQEKMSKMILESDIIMQIAIVESLLNEKLEKEHNNGEINNGKN